MTFSKYLRLIYDSVVVEGTVCLSAVASVSLSLVSIVLGNQESLPKTGLLHGRVSHYLGYLDHSLGSQVLWVLLKLQHSLQVRRDGL